MAQPDGHRPPVVDLDRWWPLCAAIQLRTGLRERLLATRLLQRLRANGQLPGAPEAQLRCLAPLLTQNADEQSRYEDLVQRCGAALMQPAGGPGSAAAQAPAAAAASAGRSLRPQARHWFVGGLVLALLLLVIAAMQWHWAGNPSNAPTPDAPVQRASGGLQIDDGKQPAAPPDSAASAATSPFVIPQHPFPIPDAQAPAWADSLRAGLLAAAALSAAFTAWRLWRRWRRHRLYADAARVPEAAVEQRLLRDPHARPLRTQASVLAPAARLLRQRQPGDTLQLNLRATIHATIRQGGLLAARWQPRSQTPEYLALIERGGGQDHQAAYHEALVQALQQQGVMVEVFYFRGSPGSGCWRLGPPQPIPGQPHALPQRLPQQTQSFEALAARYPQHRLMVFADAGAARQPITGTAAAWTTSARRMAQRVWFTPLPVANWGEAEGLVSAPEGLDFLLLPMEQAALRAVAEWLGSGRALLDQDARSPQHYPRLLQQDPETWAVRPVPPPRAVQAQLLAQLRDYLGPRFTPWLAACALYPALAWPLTVLFGRELLQARSPADPASPSTPPAASPGGLADDAELAIGLGALGALPWFRGGRMPRWLRRALIRELSPEQVKQLRARLLEHLTDSWQGHGEAIAPLAKPTPEAQRRQLAWWLKTQARGDLTDVVLLRFLDPALAPGLASRLPDTIRRWLFPDGVVMMGLRPWAAAAAMLPMLLGLLCLPPVWQQLPVGAEPPTLEAALLPAPTQVRDFALSGDGRVLAVASGGITDDQARMPNQLKLVRADQPEAAWPGSASQDLPGAALAVALGDQAVATVLVQSASPSGQTVRQRFAADANPAQDIEPGITDAGLAIRGLRVQGRNDLGSWYREDADLLDIVQTNEAVFAAMRPDQRQTAALMADGNVHLRPLADSTATSKQDSTPVDIALGKRAGQAMLYSPDSSLLWVGLASGDVQAHRPDSGKPLSTWPAVAPGTSASRVGPVTALAASPDGQRLAAGHADGQVTLWDTATQTPIMRLEAMRTGSTASTDRLAIVRLQFSPDGAALWLLGADGRLRRHGTAPGNPTLAVVDVDCADAGPAAPKPAASAPASLTDASKALIDRLDRAPTKPGTGAIAAQVIGMPGAQWLAWGYGRQLPVEAGLSLPEKLRGIEGMANLGVWVDTAQPETPLLAAATGLREPTLTRCRQTVPPPPPPDVLPPTPWPEVAGDAERLRVVAQWVGQLTQADRSRRPEATQRLLATPDLLSDVLPPVLARVLPLVGAPGMDTLDGHSRLTQVVQLAAAASPVTLQRQATALNRLLDGLGAMDPGTELQQAVRQLRSAMASAKGLKPQVQIVAADASQRAAARQLQSQLQQRGLEVTLRDAPAAQRNSLANGWQALGAADRALGRWLARQAQAAQRSAAWPMPDAEQAAADQRQAEAAWGSSANGQVQGDRYRLVLASPPAATVAATLPPPAASPPTASPLPPATVPATAPVDRPAGQATGPTESSAPSPTRTANNPGDRDLKPLTRFRDCLEDTLCPWLIALPAGEFQMGSPKEESGRSDVEDPQHRVRIRQPFALMEAEVTVGHYRTFVLETGYRTTDGCNIWDATEARFVFRRNAGWDRPGFTQTEQHPVVCLSWDDARSYARWLSAKTGQPYLLPTEVQWEYAARAGTRTHWSFGDDEGAMCRYANVADTSLRRVIENKDRTTYARCDDGRAFTAAGKTYRANPWGLYDMHGNAWEWVQDCWHEDYRLAPEDEREWQDNCGRGDRRVARGGGWVNIPQEARSAIRIGLAPTIRSNDVGFRLARTLSP